MEGTGDEGGVWSECEGSDEPIAPLNKISMHANMLQIRNDYTFECMPPQSD